MRMIQRGSMCLAVCAALIGFGALGSVVGAQDKKDTMESHQIVHFSDLKWIPIIKGCDLAQVAGDFNAEGVPFVLRIRCADGTKIPAHWHPGDESVTVLKGTFLVGMGETFNETKLQTMNVGSFTVVPKEMRHFGMAKGDFIVQVHGIGPFKNNWVNPSECSHLVQPPHQPRQSRNKYDSRLLLPFDSLSALNSIQPFDLSMAFPQLWGLGR